MNKLMATLLFLIGLLMLTAWFSWISDRSIKRRLDDMQHERAESVVRTRTSVDSMKWQQRQILANQDTIKNLLRQE